MSKPAPDSRDWWQEIAQALAIQYRDMRAALADVLAQFNAGYFVRNTDSDGCSDWAIKAVEPLRALAAAQALLKATARTTGADYAVDPVAASVGKESLRATDSSLETPKLAAVLASSPLAKNDESRSLDGDGQRRSAVAPSPNDPAATACLDKREAGSEPADSHSKTKGLASSPPPGSGWQPIETAPKDGTRILVAWPNGAVQESYFAQRSNRWNDNSRTPPTHWMPLPDPPGASSPPPGSENDEEADPRGVGSCQTDGRDLPQPPSEPVRPSVENEEETTWRDVALRVGERLSPDGPPNYYAMDPPEWLNWVWGLCDRVPEDWRPAFELLLDAYVKLALSGDAGDWDPETEPVVIKAREQLGAAALRLRDGVRYFEVSHHELKSSDFLWTCYCNFVETCQARGQNLILITREEFERSTTPKGEHE